MERKYHAPAADGVLELLEFLAENPGEWGPTELNRRIGLGTNLIFRILNVLTEHGYVSRTAEGKYVLGAKLYSLGMALHSRFDLRIVAHPFLNALAEESGETCQLQIPDGDRMLMVDCVHPPRDYFLAVNPGARLYYHCNAFGKVVLAFADAETRNTILDGPLEKLTPDTITDPAKLRAELLKVRRTFSAFEFGEYFTGGYCVGSPVFNAAGNAVAGIGISGLTSRVHELDIEAQAQLVRDCARNITQAFGGKFHQDKI